jgi:hypothetical protein
MCSNRFSKAVYVNITRLRSFEVKSDLCMQVLREREREKKSDMVGVQ